MNYQRRSKPRITEKEPEEKTPVQEKCIVTAKIPQELFDKCENIREIMAIRTRNELVERALRLYVAACTYGMSKNPSKEEKQ